MLPCLGRLHSDECMPELTELSDEAISSYDTPTQLISFDFSFEINAPRAHISIRIYLFI